MRFDSIGVVTAEMAATLAFYRLLGLDIPDEADTEGHVEVIAPGGVRVLFDSVEVMQSFSDWTPPPGFGSGEPPAQGHRMGIAFKFDSPQEVDDAYRRLTDAGHRGHLEPFDAFWGMRYATVFDPSGNPVDLAADLA